MLHACRCCRTSQRPWGIASTVKPRLYYKYNLGFSYINDSRNSQTRRTMASRSRGKRKTREETPDHDDGRESPPPIKRANASSSSSRTSAIASFFTPTSQKAAPVEFQKDGSLLFGSWKPTSTTKTTSLQVQTSVTSTDFTKTTTSSIVQTEVSDAVDNVAQNGKLKFAGFDLDSNLISTKSGNKFAKDGDDWKWWHPSVPKKLRESSEEGFHIVIFTNQNGLKASGSKAEAKNKEFKKKINSITMALNLPISLYAATESDQYRKPRTGMFERYLQDLGEDASSVDLERSIFVGDAAGRKGDFNSSDREFADMIGVKFLTPEEYFLGADPEPFEFDINPVSIPRSTLSPGFKKEHPVELVLLCGRPAAGKSTLTTKYLEPMGYERVNQDILKTKDKCLKAAEGYLKEGKSVVIDATNPTKEVRTEWRRLAAKIGNVACRCIYLSTAENLCKHNDAVRSFSSVPSLNPEKRTVLPDIAFNTFKAKFQEPEASEGFTDITVLDFEFRGTDAEYGVWKRHWI
ncbi:hypothetical protein TWF694_005948 [Orbilia ellipsospora]|uniref:Uncharacterized protein n=1 Tax=Orbilia ellipsospora TaxID=2528407 RepID=A0AAV9WU05_9PEZI